MDRSVGLEEAQGATRSDVGRESSPCRLSAGDGPNIRLPAWQQPVYTAGRHEPTVYNVAEEMYQNNTPTVLENVLSLVLLMRLPVVRC